MKESRIIIMLMLAVLFGLTVIAVQLSSVVGILNECMQYD
ncbi:hypothetical protein SAMN05216383_1395 [Prevotella sp. KH2C16]|nr:hypothetical protein SAMN05216383_1395 [Prevotella sp. KH2C16]